jgi:hypothetical protein
MTGIFYDTEEITMKYDREYMVAELEKKVCQVVFTKANGEERKMNCTLQESVLPPRKTDKELKPNLETLRVFDTDKNAWRSFRLDSVTMFNV